ncbi:MAG: choice-of-anchor L domain-containing protein [Cryomorphaceae bacterium]|nr:choice-of-anchor L domain-containing protein [Cryomorphaceae bacterium]
MKNSLLAGFLLFASAFTSFTQQSIQFAPVTNIDMMIANIFGIQCGSVSNVQVTAGIDQIGRFEYGSTIGLNSGLVMTTGAVAGSNQPSSEFSSTMMMSNGDADIDAFGVAAGQSYPSYDAGFIEFDFTPTSSDTVRFNYILASEEYPEFANTSFTDRFLFLISENGAPYVNVATIPGTSIPVEINSINATVNPQFYIDNSTSLNFVFDGYTVPLEAKFFAQAGVSYHVKLVIADLSDSAFETNGTYNADSLETGMYHIRFTPDAAAFPGVAPLYYTSGDTWSTASVIGIPCFFNSGNINSTTLAPLSGDGVIGGTIIIDTNFLHAPTVPFENALIKLVNSANETVAFTYSAVNGSYQFNNVPIGNYTLKIDVPYIPQLTDHQITIAGNQTVSGANFEIMSNGILAQGDLVLNVEETENQYVSCYPNPAKNVLTISNTMAEEITISIYSLNGRLIQTTLNHPGTTQIDISNLASGVYILKSSTHHFTQRVVKL